MKALPIALLLPLLVSAAEVEQHLGATVPSALAFNDAEGHATTWAKLPAAGRVTVLVPAYYRCDTLCGTTMHGIVEALADTGLPASAWRVVGFSVDPADTPEAAQALQTVYRHYAQWARPAVFGQQPIALQLLTTDAATSTELSRRIGFRFDPEPGDARTLAHVPGLVVLTPDGTVSRYLFGVRFEPGELRRAIVDASDHRIGTLADRFVIACSHASAWLGRHDALVLGLVRGAALAALLGLVGWIWRHRRARSA